MGKVSSGEDLKKKKITHEKIGKGGTKQMKIVFDSPSSPHNYFQRTNQVKVKSAVEETKQTSSPKSLQERAESGI